MHKVKRKEEIQGTVQGKRISWRSYELDVNI